ncbi:MAG: polyprenyl synthetase family protein [Gammaproteobacteria bacterium]|nr:polyprenyl synthetase family protein [Gammaproteobacteria bacterium]
MTYTLTHLMSDTQSRIENIIKSYLIESPTPAPLLQQAMAYSALNGGKRIRPLLVYATGLALDADLNDLDSAACAIELMHTYSLIHDDLPAMDNSDFRRGKPSCHKAFGEAMAILAGDALQTLAFQLLAAHPSALAPEKKLEMIKILSEASGLSGMGGGQTLDISHEKLTTIEELTQLHQLKTGALLTASVQFGLLGAQPQTQEVITALESYAHSLGLAYQIQDDLLDIEIPSSELGKPQGLDAANNKVTFPSLLGISKTKEKVQELTNHALNSLAPLGEKSLILQEVAKYLLHRKQ